MQRSKVPTNRVHTGDSQLDDIQANGKRSADALNLCPFINGRLAKAQALTVASKTFDHGLGRTPRGCLVLSANVATAVGFPSAQPPDTTRQSNLTAIAAATADLWWF